MESKRFMFLGVNETSFQKRHEYVTAVADNDRGIVQHVADGRGKKALSVYYRAFFGEDLAAAESVAMEMWEARDRQEAKQIFHSWYSGAIRSRLVPMKRVARMIKNHLTGILNAIVSGITNARIEGLNTKIQWLKRSARSFRSREQFRRTIYFHLGGLDLYTEIPTHTNS